MFNVYVIVHVFNVSILMRRKRDKFKRFKHMSSIMNNIYIFNARQFTSLFTIQINVTNVTGM